MVKKDKKGKKNRKRIARQERRKRIRDNGGAIARILTEYNFRIIVYVSMLTIFGLIMVFSAGYYSAVNMIGKSPYYYLERHGMFVALGIVAMVICARIDYNRYKKFYILLAVFSIVSLLLVFSPLGVTVNFARRWINLGIINVTPSELSKLFMIIFTSAFLAENPVKVRSFVEGVLPLMVVTGMHFALIVKQPNLSTAIVIVAIVIGIMLVAGLNMAYVAAGGVAGVAGTVYILTNLKQSHWYARLTNWVDPFVDSQGAGYQLSQSILALGNGGFFGRGLGRSVSKNLYLPEPQNDFILAIIGEELGFFGIFLLMSLYLLLIYEGFKVAANAKDKFGFYLASGITIMLALQVIINVAVVTASMPTTGITLPFVSYGGTSVIVFLASMGILLNISHSSNIESVNR